MPATQSLVRRAALTLALDAATAEIGSALRARGIRALVLRGPAIARRLYEEHEPRAYVDVDLLVDPVTRASVEKLLTTLGFVPVVRDRDLAGHRPVHAHEWRREAVSVDLHRTIAGVGASEAEVWTALLEDTREEDVAGERVLVPGDASLALICALHAAHNGPREAKPLEDLDRASARLDERAWDDAADLAGRLEALDAFAAGLRLAAEGDALASRLALPRAARRDVALRASGAPPLALGLDWLAQTHGFWGKARLVAHVLVPPPGALRLWRPLARRGRIGLIAAYASQPIWLARHAWPSLRALRRV